MSWLKRVLGFGGPKPAGKIKSPARTAELPLGLSRTRMISLDRNLKQLLIGESAVVVPDDEKVWAVGTVYFDQGKRILRFYLENKGYYVLFVMDGPGPDDIEDIILFEYSEVKTVASRAELRHLVGPGSKIGVPYYELDDAEYTRQWGDEDGHTEMTPMTEQVVDAEEKSYSVRHHSILYARDLKLTNRREYLFFSAEENEEGCVSLSTAIGVTLKITDIAVV